MGSFVFTSQITMVLSLLAVAALIASSERALERLADNDRQGRPRLHACPGRCGSRRLAVSRSAPAAVEGWKAEARAAGRNLDAATVAIALEL